METGIVALRIDREGFVALRDEAEIFVIRRGDPADWEVVRRLAVGQRWLAVHVPDWAALQVALPARTRKRRELREMLRDAAPVLPEELVWTSPRSLDDGKAGVSVVRRLWLDDHCVEVETEMPMALHVIVEPTGDPLRYRSPAVRLRNRLTATIVSGSLLVSAIALALTARGTPPSEQLLGFTGLGATPSVSATLLKLGFSAPAGTRLVAISADPSGSVALELDAPDPNIVHRVMAGQRSLGRWTQTRQVRRADASYRVTYRASPVGTVRGHHLVLPLAARSPGEAITLATSILSEHARAGRVELQLTRGSASASNPLVFGVSLAGPQASVLALADRIQSGTPAIRIDNWRLQPDPTGVRLTGALVVPWMLEP